jgi:polysaccharide pyruvyl transferase WcaK-like protein
MKILLGGVPFGRNNVGDEAILECVVRIVREARPDALISVSTDDRAATAAKLDVRTVPLFGFDPPFDRQEMIRELESHDAFIWAGATGLSDYPEIPTEMLRHAQAAGRQTVVWQVGMNSELNPAKYRVLPGRKRAVLNALSTLSLGAFPGVAWEERRRVARARNRIAEALNTADLVVVRDPESRAQLGACGVTRDVCVGADSALVLEAAANPAFGPEAAAVLAFPGPKIGLCVSAQREIANRSALVDCLNRLVESNERRVLFIPMNPITDAALMEDIRRAMRYPDRAATLTGRHEPAQILAAAARVNVIISSRLHLLIFASIVHTPFIGISRGSKVDHFLAPFGLRSVGSVETCNFDAMRAEVLRLLDDPTAFATHSQDIRRSLLARLDVSRQRLSAVLSRGANAQTSP